MYPSRAFYIITGIAVGIAYNGPAEAAIFAFIAIIAALIMDYNEL